MSKSKNKQKTSGIQSKNKIRKIKYNKTFKYEHP